MVSGVKRGIKIECQVCGWVGVDGADLIAPWSGMEPVCPRCWGSDFLDWEEEDGDETARD